MNLVQVLLLLSSAVVISSQSTSNLSELTSYVVSVAEHLANRYAGTFRCILYDWNLEQPFDGILEGVLRSPKLVNVVKMVLDGTFRNDSKRLPKKPDLLVVHGTSKYATVDAVLKRFLPNTRILVLMNEYDYSSVSKVIHSLRFSKVVYLDKTKKLVIRTNLNGFVQQRLEHFPAPEDLFRNAVRDLQGEPITMIASKSGKVTYSMNYVAYLYVNETAVFLNGTKLLFLHPCLKSKEWKRCIKDYFFNKRIDIDLDERVATERSNEFAIVYNIVPDAKVVLVPRGRPMNLLEMFIAPFTRETWIVLVLGLIVLEVIHLVFPSLFRNDPVLLVICSLERYSLHQASRVEKMMLLSMIVCFFFTSNAYESKFMSMITFKPSYRTINTLQELVKSGIKVKRNLHLDSRIVEHSQIGKLVVHSGDFLTEFDGVHAYVEHRGAVKFVLPHYYFDAILGRTTYVMLREELGLTVGAFYLHPRSPMVEMFDYTQRCLVEGGIMPIFLDEVIHKFIRVVKVRKQTVNDSDLLGIEDLVPAWIACGVGLGIATVVLLGEMVGGFIRRIGLEKIVV